MEEINLKERALASEDERGDIHCYIYMEGAAEGIEKPFSSGRMHDMTYTSCGAAVDAHPSLLIGRNGKSHRYALFFADERDSTHFYSIEGFVYDDVRMNQKDDGLFVAIKRNKRWGLLRVSPTRDSLTDRHLFLFVEDFTYRSADAAQEGYAKHQQHHIDTPEWPVWSPMSFLRDFSRGFSWHNPSRQRVFEYTIDAIRRRYYRLNDFDGDTVTIPLSLHDLQPSTTFFGKDDMLSAVEEDHPQTEPTIEVWNMDCLDAALKVSDKMRWEGASDDGDATLPLVLNMASDVTPGGGVVRGAGAQEENLFRRTDYLCSLFQYSRKALQYANCGVGLNAVHQYPLDRLNGAVYSPGVTVFRGNEADGYPFLRETYPVDFLAVAALNLRDKPLSQWAVNGDGDYIYSKEEAQTMLFKIHLLLRIAKATRHRRLVLSAFGCGAFMNPAKEVARLFDEALHDEEFASSFSHIVFAILEDKNSHTFINPEGNAKPFADRFCRNGNEN
jgi:uncharacterized protein (TIGR02452 family)